MKKINLAVTGCLGRMGQQIIKSAKQDKNFKLVAITENEKKNKLSCDWMYGPNGSADNQICKI